MINISLDVAYLNYTRKNQLISSALGIQSKYENDDEYIISRSAFKGQTFRKGASYMLHHY
jgi:hypothetical protein